MNTIVNTSNYPTREVKKIVRRALGYVGVDVRRVTVQHFVKRTWAGERTWMGGWYQPGGAIVAKIVKPEYKPHDYVPYSRKRGTCPRFELRDWREQLVALVAHEAYHHRQWLRSEPYVEADADLAAYRAVGYWREDES